MSSPEVAPGLEPRPAGGRRLEPRQWQQIAWITAGAIAIFTVFRLLPTGTNLSHMDFRVDPRAGNVIEFCDPVNPQFIPVIAARSPVIMAITTTEPAASGREVKAVLSLKTASGKGIAPEDLLVTHTRRLHLLIIDPTLTDYQHVHPEPMRRAGEWSFSFTPHAAGAYRIFADFTPAVTGRGLYASTDLKVGQVSDLTAQPRSKSKGQVKDLTHGDTASVVEREGYRFALVTAQPPRAGQPMDLRFTVTRTAGGAVPLEPVMGAYAHLVAFDPARTGFAHLHPTATDLLKRPDAVNPVLNFKLTIPQAGRFVVWAQVNVAGRETFVPFALEVGK